MDMEVSVGDVPSENKSSAETKPNQNLGSMEKLADASEILQTLECQVCQEVPLPPISSCENGHIVCNVCHPKLQQCSLCRAKFTTSRNWAIESIVNSSTFRCINSSIGCPKVLKGEEHAEHLKSCDFRPVPCHQMYTKKCKGALIPYNEYLNHLFSIHKIYQGVMVDKEGIRTMMKTKFPENREVVPFCIQCDGKHFLAQDRFYNGSLYRWVNIVGSEADALAYKATMIIIKGEEVEESKIVWTFPVSSFRNSFSEILSSGKCAALPITVLRNFSVKDETSEKTQKLQSRYIISRV